MMTQLANLKLARPAALGAEAWAPIEDAFVRFQRAAGEDDRPLIIGSAKDLAESVARVVLDVRGDPAGSNADFLQVLGAAHKAIENQPGPGVSPDAPVRQAADAARKMASQLRQLRNNYGTGHGRATLPTIEDEILETCVAGYLFWTRWALRRLSALLIGLHQQLVHDLGSAIFRRGDLADRLRAVDLLSLSHVEQRLLGVAVGRRTATDTVNVRVEGVEACVNSVNDSSWPLGYREGVIEGLFLDSEGHVRVDSAARGPRLAAQILAIHPEQTRVATDLRNKLSQAAWSSDFHEIWQQVVAELRATGGILVQPEAVDAWTGMGDDLQVLGDSYDRTHS